MLKLKSFAHVDFLGAIAAMGWAIAAQFIQELNNLLSWEVAGAFAVVALGRWAASVKKKSAEERKALEEKAVEEK